MSKGINLETYRFIGDSSVNEVKFSENGKIVGTYTQTEVVEALGRNRTYINGGIKLKTKEADSRLAYLIYFGGSKDEPKQIIKIIFDKQNLEIGDPNTLAIENLCEYSIKVRNNRIKSAVLSGVASVAIAGSLVGGMIWAGKRESEVNNKKMDEYQQQLQEQRMEEGTYKSFLEDQGLIVEDEIELNSGRSF